MCIKLFFPLVSPSTKTAVRIFGPYPHSWMRVYNFTLTMKRYNYRNKLSELFTRLLNQVAN